MKALRQAVLGLFTFDPRSLAAYRILFAIIILCDLFYRARDLSLFYTDAGVLPRSHILVSAHPWDVSLHMMSGTWEIQAVLFCFAAVAAILMLVGYRTPEATVWSWILLLSLHRRNSLIVQGGDELLRVMLFWSMFLPLGRAWSWDSKRRRALAESPERDVQQVVSVGSFCFLIQVIFVYLLAGIQKTGVQWTIEGTAGFYALSLDQFATPLGQKLLQYPELLRVLTFAVVPLEMYGPLLLLVPVRTSVFRMLVCCLFFAFHGGLLLTMQLGPFSYVCLALWTAFLPAEFWNSLKIKPFVQAYESSIHEHGWVFRTVRGMLLSLVLVHVALWNLRTTDYRKWSTLYPFGYDYVLKLLGLDQNWGMFAPYPLTGDGWFKISATTLSGKTVNLSPGSKSDDPLTDKRPECVSATFPSERWRKMLLWLRAPINVGMRPIFMRALALRWAEAHPEDRLKSMDMYFYEEIMLPTCKSTPVEMIHLAHSDEPESGL